MKKGLIAISIALILGITSAFVFADSATDRQEPDNVDIEATDSHRGSGFAPCCMGYRGGHRHGRRYGRGHGYEGRHMHEGWYEQEK